MKNLPLIVKVLLIPAFFVIANTANVIVANTIAGVMVIATVLMFIFDYVNKNRK